LGQRVIGDSLTDEQIQDINDFAEKIRADIQLVDDDFSSQKSLLITVGVTQLTNLGRKTNDK
jgi:archaellum component FlaC